MDKWQLVGILGLVGIAACWGLAIVLYRVGTTGSVARKLAVLLVVEGFVLATAEFPEFASGLGVSYWESFFESNPMLLFFLDLFHHLGDAAMIALYPPFLALALNTNLTRPFADTRVRIGLAIGSVVLVLAVLFSPSRIGTTLLYSMVTLLFVYAMVASIHAWRTAKRGMARKRAGIFALAFGLRDLGWVLSYAISAWVMWTQPELTTMTVMTDIGWLGKFVYALGTLLAVPLIAYGILRSHLFDIDLRIRWTIKQSTLATIFVTLIFLISEGADRFLSAELGNFAGLLAAAVVVFFLAPLQRFAEGVASVAMPNTKNTPEYTTFRKMQVYEEAVSEAHYEGGISEKERALLVRLRDSLGISETDADAIEGELTKSQPSFA
jgi:hypothetical protein